MPLQKWFIFIHWLLVAGFFGLLLYLFAGHYTSCRIDGTGKLGCFPIAFIGSLFETFVLIIAGIVKALMFVLP